MIEWDNTFKLRTLIEGNGKIQAWVAKELGCKRGTLTNIINKRKTPSLRLAAAIERWSNGYIKAVDWVVDDA